MSEAILRAEILLGPLYAIPRDGLGLAELVPIVEAAGYRVVAVEAENNRLHIDKKD